MSAYRLGIGAFALTALSLFGCGPVERSAPGGGATGAVGTNGGAADAGQNGGRASAGQSRGGAAGAGAVDPSGGGPSGTDILDSLAVPSFQRIAVQLPSDLEAKVPTGAAMHSSVQVTSISVDGSAVVASVDFRWEPPAGGAGRSLRWTPETGARLLPLPWAHAVSGDGSVVFSELANYEMPPNLFRWTEEEGSVDLVTPELAAEFPYGFDFPPSEGPFTSGDGQALLARGSNDSGLFTVLWQAETGWRTLGRNDEVAISADGGVVTVGPDQIWTRARDLETLPDTCTTSIFAPASGVVIVACHETPNTTPTRVFELLPNGAQSDLDGPGTPMAANADGSVVLFTNDFVDSKRGASLARFRPVALWSESTGTLPLADLDGSETVLGVADDGVTVLFNDIDELDPGVPDTDVSSIPLRWSPESGRQDLEIPTSYEYGYATTHDRDASTVAGFVFDGSYLGPTIHSESTYRSARWSGAVTVWDEQGPRLLTEELADLVDDPSDIEIGRPLFVRRTERAIYVIGTGLAPDQPTPTPGPGPADTTVWVAALPLR